MVKRRRRSYRSIWQFVFVSLSLLPCLSHTYANFSPFWEIKCESYIFVKKNVMVPPCLFIIHPFIMLVWYTTKSVWPSNASIHSLWLIKQKHEQRLPLKAWSFLVCYVYWSFTLLENGLFLFILTTCFV